MRKAIVLVGVVACALFLVAPTASHAQYQPGQPGFILTPSTSPPGGQITAVGFGCGRNEPVVITINEQTVGTGQSSNDSSGSFSITFTAPSAPGTYVVTARCGNIVQSSVLTISAVATVTSGSLPATGSDTSVPLTRIGLALVVLGGFAVLLTRRRREARV